MKTALVTGAAGGIGEQIARALASDGVRVILHYNKSREKAMEIAKEIRGEAVFADLENDESIFAMTDKVNKQYGGADILVNNAGIAMQKMLCDTKESDWDRIFNINMRAAFIITREIMPKMVRNKYGRIVNVSSVWGETGASCEVAYSASKAALIGFTKALAKELSLSGICVNCVAPGVIDTKMNDIIDKEIMSELAEEIPAGRIGKPEEVAALAAFLCSEKASYITGQVIGANGGMYM